MKRKPIAVILLTLMLTMLLTGCVQTVITFDIKSDLSGSLGAKVGVNEDVMAMLGDVFSGYKEELQYDDFEVKDYHEDGYVGIEVSKHVDDMTKISAVEAIFNSKITNENGKIIFRMATEDLNSTFESAGESSGYGLDDMMTDYKVVVHMPGDAVKTNATEVKDGGKTLIWDMLMFSEDELYAECRNASPVLPVILIVLVVIAIIVAVFFVIRAKKTGNAETTGQNNTGFSAVNDGTQAGYQEGTAFCPKCGTRYKIGATFCIKCGNRLSQPEAAAAPDAEVSGDVNAGAEAGGDVNAGAEAGSDVNADAEVSGDVNADRATQE